MTDKLSTKWRWILLVIVFASIGITAKSFVAEPSTAPQISVTQDIRNLENRINLLEQRFYSMESNINRLQQQVSLSGRTTAAQPSNDPHVDLLRSELESLKARIREVECGLAHLDERTLSATAKTRRRTGEQTKDPCRQNPEESVQLTLRR